MKGAAYTFPESSRHETINTGSEPRLLLGPMSEEGFAVGGPTTTTIAGDASNVYIRQIEGSYEYSFDQINWVLFNTPTTVINTDTGAGILTVEFVSDFEFTSINDYFICGSSHIQFGSASLKNDGSRPIITVDGISDYLGLIRNGTSGSDGYSNITVFNLAVNATNGSTLATNGGWIGHEYFGKGAIENYIINCASNGPISENSGGIVGSSAASGALSNLTIIGCSSSGLIGTAAGGIVGSVAGTDGGEINCQSCWTTGDIDVSGGGILGSNASSGLIKWCYSTGDISGGAGGICGAVCAVDGRIVTIEYCYSEGDIAANAGGIVGANAANAYISYCYSLGNMAATTSGGIFAATNSTAYLVNYCYTVGTVTGSQGYIIGASGEFPPNCFSEAFSNPPGGTWNPDNANTALNVGGSEEFAYVFFNNPSQPYELSYVGYTPYTRANIDLSFIPALEKEFGSSVSAGSSTAAAIVPGKNYTLFSTPFQEIPNSITIDPNTGIISTTAETVPGFYGFGVRNTGSYYISFYGLDVLEAAGTYIDGSGGTTVYIRQSEGDNEYSYNLEDWNIFTSPPIFRNTDTTTGMFTVEFDSDILFNSSEEYFICGTSHIQFGSTSLNEDGSRPVITINDVADYPGLIQNGTVDVSGYSNIHVFNLLVDVSNGSTLVNDGGWLGQEYFGKDASDNYIINCSSTGPISSEGGGIVGAHAGSEAGASLTIIGCSSSGEIDNEAGGIAGRHAGNDGGSIRCESCWSTGFIGNEGGGITGEDTENATILNCYSTGEIDNESGGICGQDCSNSTITNCYSTGSIGSQAGGIVGEYASGLTITNCYSLGSIGSDAGGIIGPTEGTNTITNCYTAGTVTDDLGYIIGESDEIPLTCFSEAFTYTPGGTWNSTHANTVLQGLPTPVVGTTWVATVTNEPYELFNMGYTPYTAENVIIVEGDMILNRGVSESITAGASTNAGLVPGRSYTILQIADGNSGSITINSTTGVISTSGSTAPGTYTIYLRNTGSYNITEYILSFIGNSDLSCCDRPTFALGPNTGYAEYTELRAGNIMMETVRRQNLSYDQLMTIRKAQSSKK
jgi:hypothetical protein